MMERDFQALSPLSTQQELYEALETTMEEVRQLREFVFGGPVFWPRPWNLTGAEGNLLHGLLLCRRRSASKSYLLEHVCKDRPMNDWPEVKIIDVFVCKMRKKLKPFGVVIKTDWGEGYRLEDDQVRQGMLDQIEKGNAVTTVTAAEAAALARRPST